MKRILTVAAATAIAFTTLVLPASADEMGTAAVGCTESKAKVSVQTRENKFVDSVGGMYNCDMPNPVGFTLLVQLKNGPFWYDKVERGFSVAPNRTMMTTFTCTGQGKKTYRAQIKGYTNGGKLWVQNSPNVTVTC